MKTAAVRPARRKGQFCLSVRISAADGAAASAAPSILPAMSFLSLVLRCSEAGGFRERREVSKSGYPGPPSIGRPKGRPDDVSFLAIGPCRPRRHRPQKPRAKTWYFPRGDSEHESETRRRNTQANQAIEVCPNASPSPGHPQHGLRSSLAKDQRRGLPVPTVA